MAKVVFGEVVERIKSKVDKDHTDLSFYVGGEHILTDEIVVADKGVIKGSTIGPAFHMSFKSGDVLLMSRNPHLRKAAVPRFDGICSDVSYVCRTKDPDFLDQRYLPFVMRTDAFWRYAEEHKKGSTNYFLNWSDFADYEFDLPPIEKQRELAELLWAANDLKESYKKLIVVTDEMLKAKFREMFGERASGCNKVTLNDVCSSIVRGPFGSALKVSFFVGKGENTIKVYEQKNAINESATVGEYYITQERYKALKRFTCVPGDILMSCAGTVGRLFQLPETAEIGIINQAMCKFSLNGKMLPTAFLCYMRNMVDSLDQKGSAMKNIGAVSILKNMPISLPSLARQQEFVEIARKADETKVALKKSIADVESVIKGLING